jgi:hypothetical protein
MSDPLQLLLEKDRIIDLINQLFIATDRRRVDVRGDQATAFCYGIASHYRSTRSGRNTRAFIGSYDFHLLRMDGRWQIDSFRFNLKYIDGNAELERKV